MSVQRIIQESVNKNPLGLKEAFAEELAERVRLALEAKMSEELEEGEDFDLSDYTVEELEDFMMSEEFEQLDEISQGALDSYISRASHSTGSGHPQGGSENAIDKLRAKAKAHKTLGNDAEAKKYNDKLKKRRLGLSRAIARYGARERGTEVAVKGSSYEKHLKTVPKPYFKK